MAGFAAEIEFMGAADELDLWGLRVARNNTEVSGLVKLSLTGMGRQGGE